MSRVATKAKLLLLALLLLIFGSGAYLLYARGTFESTQQLILLANDSEGVSVGMDLTFSGFPVGRVRHIGMADDGLVRIRVDIPEKEAHWLRVSSIFTMERNLLGATRLRAYTGIYTDPLLPDGAERVVLQGDAMAEIPQVVSTVRDLLDNIKRLTDERSALTSTLESAQVLMAGLAGRDDGADDSPVVSLLNETNLLLQRVEGLVSQADDRLFAPDHSVMSEFQGLLADTRRSMVHVDAILQEAQGIAANTRSATDDLDVLRAQMESSLHTVESMVQTLQQQWPFRSQPQLELP